MSLGGQWGSHFGLGFRVGVAHFHTTVLVCLNATVGPLDLWANVFLETR